MSRTKTPFRHPLYPLGRVLDSIANVWLWLIPCVPFIYHYFGFDLMGWLRGKSELPSFQDIWDQLPPYSWTALGTVILFIYLAGYRMSKRRRSIQVRTKEIEESDDDEGGTQRKRVVTDYEGRRYLVMPSFSCFQFLPHRVYRRLIRFSHREVTVIGYEKGFLSYLFPLKIVRVHRAGEKNAPYL
ncbi:MAG: hypothetical protein AAGN35_27705 [Bacteroidota bacterium]